MTKLEAPSGGEMLESRITLDRWLIQALLNLNEVTIETSMNQSMTFVLTEEAKEFIRGKKDEAEAPPSA